MSKKLLSIVLCVLMVISTVSCLFTMTASAVELMGEELISNGDFSVDQNVEQSGILASSYHSVSIDTVTPTTVDSGKWYRNSSGASAKNYYDAVALRDDDGNIQKTDDVIQTKAVPSGSYPDIFAPNSQIIVDPENSNNYVARAVQALHQPVDVKGESAYTLTFKFRLAGTTEKLSSASAQTINMSLAYFANGTKTETSDGNYTAVGKISSVTTTLIPITKVNVSSKNGTTAAVNSNGNVIFTVNADKLTEWDTVTLTFSTGSRKSDTGTVFDSADYEPVLLFATNATGTASAINPKSSEAYSGYWQHAFYMDDVSLKEIYYPIGEVEFYNANGKIENANDYGDVETTISDDKVTATIKYDNESGAYRFIGWYDTDGDLYSTNETITFTAGENVKFTPRIATDNLMGSVASYESVELTDDIRYIEQQPGAGVVPNFPEGNKWGLISYSGYHTYDAKNAIYQSGTFDEAAVLKTDGSTVVQTYGYRGTSGATWETYSKRISVIGNENARSGYRALALTSVNNVPVALGISVNPNTKYTLTYYVKDSDTTVTENNFGSAIFSSINLGGTLTGSNLNSSIKTSSGTYVRVCDGIQNGTQISGTNCAEFMFSKTFISDVSAIGWTKIQHTFETKTHTKVYLVHSNNAGSVLYIDDFVLVEESKNTETLEVKFEDQYGNEITAANESATAEILDNYDGSVTATVDYDRDSGAYVFKGWYEDGKCVSVKENYIYEKDTHSDLTAVITSRNLISDVSGSFEGYTAGEYLSASEDRAKTIASTTTEPGQGEWIYSKNNGGYYGALKAGTFYDANGNKYTQTTAKELEDVTGASAIVDNTVAHSGENSLKLSCNYRSLVMPIDVKPNTDYSVSYYLLGTLHGNTKYAEEIKHTGIATTVNIGQGTTPVAEDEANASVASELKEAVGNFPSAIALARASYIANDGETWNKIELSFNSGDFSRVWLVVAPSYGESYYIDDIVLTQSVTSYNGTAIRAESDSKPQAMRNKFAISDDLIANGVEDADGNVWSVAEYGSIAIRTDYLNGEALKVDGEYLYGGKTRTPVKGVAYNKASGVNKIFEKDTTNNTTVFTAALTNIGKTQNSDAINYKVWNNNYSIRNYIILEKDGVQVTVYDETTVEASIYAVMNAILSTEITDDMTDERKKQIEADQAIVNSILTDGSDAKVYYDKYYSVVE